jgi:hypothetical protein
VISTKLGPIRISAPTVPELFAGIAKVRAAREVEGEVQRIDIGRVLGATRVIDCEEWAVVEEAS